jgi:hypothetical protein
MGQKPTEIIDRLRVKFLDVVNTLKIGGTALTATAAELNALAGQGAVAADFAKLHALTPGANEINVLDGVTAGATFVIGAEAGNAINVGIQLRDATPADIGTRQCVFAYLSDDANGDSIAAVAPDGGWAIGTDGLLIPVVANKAAMLTSESDGDIDINITHAAGAKTLYLILVMPNGKLAASGAITFAA